MKEVKEILVFLVILIGLVVLLLFGMWCAENDFNAGIILFFILNITLWKKDIKDMFNEFMKVV